MKTKLLVVLGLIVFLGAMSGYAQQSAIKAKIDFAFTVEGKALPAGQYEFLKDAEEPTVFQVRGAGNNFALATIITRLSGEMHAVPQVPHLVFDMVGDTYALAEVWIPGEDGYAVLVTKAPHTHKVVKMMKK